MGRPSNDWETIEAKLKARTIVDETTGCWLWQGAKNIKGYGHIKVRYRDYNINRISAFLYLGLDIFDDETHALHKPECSNKNCWNPEHLYLGTNEDNIRDKVIAAGGHGPEYYKDKRRDLSKDVLRSKEDEENYPSIRPSQNREAE